MNAHTQVTPVISLDLCLSLAKSLRTLTGDIARISGDDPHINALARAARELADDLHNDLDCLIEQPALQGVAA